MLNIDLENMLKKKKKKKVTDNELKCVSIAVLKTKQLQSVDLQSWTKEPIFK